MRKNTGQASRTGAGTRDRQLWVYSVEKLGDRRGYFRLGNATVGSVFQPPDAFGPMSFDQFAKLASELAVEGSIGTGLPFV